MTDRNNTDIAWTITLIETEGGSRFAKLHPADNWLNKYQLRRLIAILETIADIAAGKTKEA